MDKFVLDEELARDWLAGIVDSPDPTGFCLPADFRGSDGDNVAELVELAQAVGAIRCPQPGVLVAWEWQPDPSDRDGYRYLLEFRHPYPVVLTLADALTHMWALDSRPAGGEAVTGIANALGVLAQAAEAGNELLGQLGRYVAGLPAGQAA